MATIYSLPDFLHAEIPPEVQGGSGYPLPGGVPPPPGPSGSGSLYPFQTDVRLLLEVAWLRTLAWDAVDAQVATNMRTHIGNALALAGGTLPRAEIPPTTQGEATALEAALNAAIAITQQEKAGLP